MNDPFRRPKISYNSDGWTLTFVDLLSLLLAFFVLLFSMSSVKSAGWDSIVESMGDQFRTKKVEIKALPKTNKNASETVDALNLFYLSALMKSEFLQDPLLQGGDIRVENRQLVIEFPATNLFVPDSYRLKEDAQQMIKAMSIKLAQFPNSVIIEANSAENAPVYPPYSNARERALALARVTAASINNGGYSGPLTVVGSLRIETGAAGSLGVDKVRIKILDTAGPRGYYGQM